jgi:transglutaminase-like putative cysteine protease
MIRKLSPSEGWVAVLSLLLMVLCVTWSIQAAHWAEGLAILQGVVLLGGITGIVLAKSRIPIRMADLLSLLTGLSWSLFLTSRALADATGYAGPEAVVELDRRLQDFLWIVWTGGANADNYIFVLLLALLLWLMAYYCAWAVFRWRRVWLAVIVAGLALLININYAKGDQTGYLLGFLLVALLLVVRTSLASYEREWQRSGVSYSPDLVHSFVRAGLVISVLAIVLAWLAPEALASRPFKEALDKMGQPWRRLQDESAEIFDELNYQNDPVYLYSDRSVTFGGAVRLTDAPVMDVQAPTGRYWRVMVYHEYTGEGWNNTDADTILVGENERDIAFPELFLRREVTQTYTLLRNPSPVGTLIAAGQPLRAGLPLRAVVSYIAHEEDLARSRSDESLHLVPGDPSVLYSREPLASGDTYQVTSSYTTADEQSLRSAGTSYPSWIVPRYLQLPESLPERVRQLSEELAADQETPYDKAKAIEGYLREITYNEDIEAPPEGEDGVDYFLFTAKEGYCDYYSSAMVVMLRSLGVPARYVRGYSESTRDEGVFHLLDEDGHAWPEVFFPDYGWVEFEPTGGEPVLIRPARPPEDSTRPLDRPGMGAQDPNLDELMDLEPNADTLAGASGATGISLWQRIGRGGALIILLALGAGVFTALLAVRRQRLIEGLGVGERVYADLVSWVKRLFGITPLAHQTPHEYAGLIGQSVPKARQNIEQIAGLYVKERFGNKTLSDAEASVAWYETRYALWQRWFESRFERIKNFWWKFFPPKPPDQP